MISYKHIKVPSAIAKMYYSMGTFSFVYSAKAFLLLTSDKLCFSRLARICMLV